MHIFNHTYRKGQVKQTRHFPYRYLHLWHTFYQCLLESMSAGPRPPPLRPLLSASNLDLHGEADKIYKTSKPSSRPFAKIVGQDV